MTPDTEWEKEKEEFNKMWNEGKFHWNENQNTEINPQRIWNVFILPTLTSRDTYWKERVQEIVKKERGTWAKESIGDKALQSLEVALLDNLK